MKAQVRTDGTGKQHDLGVRLRILGQRQVLELCIGRGCSRRGLRERGGTEVRTPDPHPCRNKERRGAGRTLVLERDLRGPGEPGPGEGAPGEPPGWPLGPRPLPLPTRDLSVVSSWSTPGERSPARATAAVGATAGAPASTAAARAAAAAAASSGVGAARTGRSPRIERGRRASLPEALAAGGGRRPDACEEFVRREPCHHRS